MRARHLVAGILIVLVVAVVGAAIYAVSPSAIDPIEPRRADSFDPQQIARGEQLALIGNCRDCHTVSGGASFAGGRALESPLGTLYGPNITPDPETGIGRWSEAAFRRAMHEGLGRDGQHLYPAFPYDHFTLLRDEDVSALYAYIMTREPVTNRAPEHELAFPLNVRPLLAGWKLLFFDEGRFAGDADAGNADGRGAYLVRGLAHCGACHTPRNRLMAEKKDEFLGGGQSEGWHAPALDARSPAAAEWTEDALVAYLRDEWVEHHGVAAGPMKDVTTNLALVPEEDVRAMAAYVAPLMADAPRPDIPEAGTQVSAEAGAEGALIYQGACAPCHIDLGPAREKQGDEPAPRRRYSQGLNLAYSSAIRAPDPRNLIHIIRGGMQPGEGQPGYYMPGFAGALTDAQIEGLAAYLRDRAGGLPPWEDIAERIGEAAAPHGVARREGGGGGSS